MNENIPSRGFLHEIEGKNIICKLITGDIITGLFEKDNLYELVIKNGTNDIIVMKHAIATLREEKLNHVRCDGHLC